MKSDIPIRIRVLNPLEGVWMRAQRGGGELLSPTFASVEELVFDLELKVDTDDPIPNFTGQYAQGPKDARFVYVNSGTYAGQHITPWSRRAKLSLMSVTKDQVDEVLADDANVLEVAFPGVGRDGGPTCASVKGIEWKVVER